MRNLTSILSVFAMVIVGGGLSVSAFVSPFPATSGVPVGIKSFTDRSNPVIPKPLLHGNDFILLQQHAALKRQRRSIAPVQTMSLFGLGAPEIVVILVIGAFLLGPQKIAELGREAGKAAGELREVPKEFQKGVEEGETEARSKKAKQMEDVPPE